MTNEPINDKTEGTTLYGRAVKLLVSSGRFAHIGLRTAETVRWRLREVVPARGDATEFELDEAIDGGWAPLAAGQPLLANVAAAFLDWKPQAFIRIGGNQCLVECEDTASEPTTPNAAPCPVCGTPIVSKYSMVEQRWMPYDAEAGAWHKCCADDSADAEQPAPEPAYGGSTMTGHVLADLRDER